MEKNSNFVTPFQEEIFSFNIFFTSLTGFILIAGIIICIIWNFTCRKKTFKTYVEEERDNFDASFLIGKRFNFSKILRNLN